MSQQLFESTDYKVNVTREPGCQVSFNIHVSPKATHDFLRQAIKVVNKEVSLPGFRKGKAPEKLIVDHFGKQVEKEWKDIVVQESFVQAMRLTNLHPFRKDSVQDVKIVSISKEKGTEVNVFFESMPEIPTVDMKELQLEAIEPEPVTETKIQQIVEDIRYQNADWHSVEGRGVQEGDFIDVDIEDLDNLGKFICQDFRIEVTKGKIGTWLHDLLIGQSPLESREAVSRLEEGVVNHDFKSTRCKVTVKAIKASVLPPIDDQLAAKVGLKSKDELYQKVKENLEKQHQEVAREKRREALGNLIAKSYNFEVPYSITSSNAQKRITEKSQHLAKESNGEVDVKKLDEIEAETRKEVELLARWQFIAQKIAKEKHVHVSKQEVLTELILQGYIDPATGSSKARMDESPEDVMSNVYSMLMIKKVADLLLQDAESR
ncbi:trigger factor [Estrella lausannensis]|uniref:Trigger factor n=1 Tax=Estrella lausannensis TaxID=483423 RepID=A0A0H5E3H9_9BACT|nr:trigger factor [Estrella lausannensis]CRX37770.1 Trigger factor [Estrella lausannensis]